MRSPIVRMIIYFGVLLCAGQQVLTAVTSKELSKDPALIPLTMTESDLRLEYRDLPDVSGSAGSQLTLDIPKFSESLYVPARGTAAQSATVMDPGVRYQIEALGHVSLGESTTSKSIQADACFVFDAGWDTAWAKSQLPAASGSLAINGVGMKPTGPYDSGHQYTQTIAGAGRAAEFKIQDSDYRDNNGSLLVRISRILDFRMVIRPSSQSRPLMAEVSRLVKVGQTDEAVELAAKALGRSPQDYTLWNILGALYLKNAEPEKTEGLAVPATSNLGRSLSAFDKALKLKSDASEVHNNLGVAYRKMGDSARARNEFNKAFDMNPQMDPAIYNLVLLDESAKHPVEGKQPVEKKPTAYPGDSGGKK